MKTRSKLKYAWEKYDYGRVGDRHTRQPNVRTTNKAQTRKVVQNQPASPTFEMPVSPPTVTVRNVSRLRANKKDRPTCCDYGKNRRIQYPGYYFCTPCVNWENNAWDPDYRGKRNSTRNRCVATHSSWVGPTDRKLIPKRKAVITGVNRNTSSSGTGDPDDTDEVVSRKKKRRKLACPDTDTEEDERTTSNYTEPAATVVSTVVNTYSVSLSEITMAEEDNQYEVELDKIKKQIDDICDQNEKLENAKKILEKELEESLSIKTKYDHTQMEVEKNYEIIKELMMEKKESEIRIKQLLNLNKKSSNENEQLIKKLSIVQSTLKDMLNKLNEKERKPSKQKSSEYNFNTATARDVVNKFIKDLEVLSTKKNRKLRNLIDTVTQILFDEEIFEGMLVQMLIVRCQEHYRANVFSPQNLLKLMDQNGGQLSMSGIELLRTLETKGEKYNRNSILPSTASIKKATKVVDIIAQELVPFTEGVLDNGSEFCEFEVEPVVKLMIKGYGLEEASKKRSIKINQALDGARLTNRLHHTTYGLKMVDIGAVDPVTKKLIYGSTNSTTIQSKHYCHPLKIVLSNETNEVIDQFRGPMERFKKLSEHENSMELLGGAQPLDSRFNADLSAQWKILRKGYGVKRGDGNPCHICAIKDSELQLPNAVRCDRWCEELHNDKGTDWQCFHHTFLDEAKVQEM